MAKRVTYTTEEKKELIEKYLPEYLASKRSAIDGKKATKELFDELSEEEQWMKIYINYVRKLDRPTTKPSEVKTTAFTYNTVRFAINTLKKSVDVMSSEQIEKMFKDLEELQPLVESKADRMKEQELQKLAEKKKELADQLKEIEELEKELSK